MDKIIQTLKNVGPGFEYLVLGICIVTGIIILGVILQKIESHRATTKYSKKLKK